MADFPAAGYGPPALITPWNVLEGYGAIPGFGSATSAATAAWPANNDARFYPFKLHAITTVYQLFWYVGTTQSGNIDVGVYDAQKNKIISSGSVGMSASTSVVQALDVADTVLPPGEYLMGAACSLSTGTIFGVALADELALSTAPIYMQATAFPLPDPCVPVLDTASSPSLRMFGAICTATF